MVLANPRTESSRILLREIAQAGPIPRIDLSERTGLSRATVTTITANLLKRGLIEEVRRSGETDLRRGRPKVDLKISGDAHHIAGLKIAETSISYVLVDFQGTEKAAIDRPIAPGRHAPEFLAASIARGIDDLAEEAGVRREAISGVGVGLAGVTQAETGLVYWSPSLNRNNLNFRDYLSKAIGGLVFLDNDANLVAMAELKFGLGQRRNDFIVVTIEAGVGMGIVLGGHLYRGTRGSGGEFGHTKVQLGGALCRCSQRGCLEAYVADYALHREAVCVGLVEQSTPTEEALATVLHAAKNGNNAAKSVVDRARHMFAMGLANLVNIFDPELIIIAGAQMQFDHLYAEEIMQEMRQSIVQIDKPPPEVVIHKWGNRMWALGAAAYALELVQDIAVEEVTLAP